MRSGFEVAVLGEAGHGASPGFDSSGALGVESWEVGG